MSAMGKDFADRAIERYRKGSKSPAPEPTEPDGDEPESEAEDEKSDTELGRALCTAVKKGDYAAIVEAVRAIR